MGYRRFNRGRYAIPADRKVGIQDALDTVLGLSCADVLATASHQWWY